MFFSDFRFLIQNLVFYFTALASLAFVESSIDYSAQTGNSTADNIAAKKQSLFLSCEAKPEVDLTYHVVSTLTIVILAFILPVCILIITYGRVFLAARENTIKTRRNSSCSLVQDGMPTAAHTSVPVMRGQKFLSVSNNNLNLNLKEERRPTPASNLVTMTSNLTASMKSKLNHASQVLLYGEEGRAAKVTKLVLLAIIVSWGPFFSLLTYHSLSTNRNLPAWSNLLVLTLALSNTALNPILYAFRSKRVRKDVRKALGFMSRPSQASRRKMAEDIRENKLRRLRSLSCPQLMISTAANDNIDSSFDNSLNINFNAMLTVSAMSNGYSSGFTCEADSEEVTPMMLAIDNKNNLCLNVTPPGSKQENLPPHDVEL